MGLGSALLALLLASQPVGAQQARVVGTVTSAENNQPLPGANVTVKGTPIGVLTNSQGQYTLRVPSANDTLVFSLIGYAQQEVPINGQTEVSVSLAVKAVALDQIVVTGYGTQQRRDVTGSIASLQGSDVTKVATPNVVQSLQGKVAGVQVTPNSGEPGAGAQLRIRGVGTLNDASPLYVVDGMFVNDINFLTPEDVASVDVLKDASATAIYGSRGANGVVVITTKKGSASRGTTFRLNAYGGYQTVLHRIDLVNATQYAELANELAANQGSPLPFPNGYSGPSTDWQDQIFQTAPIQNYQLTASGGTDRITYYFSGDYTKQEGVVPHSTFDRVTLRLNNDYKLTDAITIGHNLNFSNTHNQIPPRVLSQIYQAAPTVQPGDATSGFNPMELSSAGNPAATVYYTDNAAGSQRLVGNVYGEANFLDHFTFRTSFGLDYDRYDERTFVPVYMVSPTQQNQQSDLNVRFNNTNDWLWENTLTWNYVSDIHRLTLLGGVTAQSHNYEDVGGSRVDIAGPDPSLWYLNAGSTAGQTNFNSAYDWKMLSYLFRANYTFMDRYLFTGSLRVDGSSRFGPDNRYGWFPSVAVGWDLAQEDFLKDVNAISALKLRASWGQTGNDKIGAYPAVAQVTSNLNYVFGDQLVIGAAPVALANPAIRWETTTQWDGGLDFALFHGRVEGTADYYNRTTNGILVQVPIPKYVGVNSEPTVNAAKVRNSGVEGTLTWYGQLGGVKLELSGNASTINNKVLALGQGREEIYGGGLINEIAYTTKTQVGHPIGSFWGYKVAGVFQTQQEIDSSPNRGVEQPGDLKYEDLNGDGVINTDDMTFIGSPIPDVVYGFDASLRMGAFDFGFGLSGQAGNQIYNGKKSIRFGTDNFETSFLDRWTGPNTSNTEPRITNAGHNYLSSDRWIESGSFLKVHSAQLGYRLPQSMSQRMGVDLARVYVSATNLFLWTDYSGYTPEVTNSSGSVIANGIDTFSGVYPPARVLTFGIDLTF